MQYSLVRMGTGQRERNEHISMSSGNHVHDFLWTMIESLSKEDQVKCYVTPSAIWHAKRKAIHDDIYTRALYPWFFFSIKGASLLKIFLYPCL
jgi:hypothetical protein